MKKRERSPTMAVADRKRSDKKPSLAPPPPPPVTKAESSKGSKPNSVAALRRSLNLNQAQFARMIALSVRSLAALEAGSKPSEAVRRRLVEMNRLDAALGEVIRRDAIGPWLQAPNPAFDGLKPLEVIERGESDRIWSMLFFLRSGVAS